MTQSRWGSLAEAAFSTALGFSMSLLLQWLYFDAYLGFPLQITQNLTFAVIMTVVSVKRGYLVRRLFVRLGFKIDMTPALRAVMAERLRQINVEGWSADHDDRHEHGELAVAGACYALLGADEDRYEGDVTKLWGWAPEWLKPRDIRRNLVRATALLLAEIERFDRNRKRRAAA